MDHISVVYILY